MGKARVALKVKGAEKPKMLQQRAQRAGKNPEEERQ